MPLSRLVDTRLSRGHQPSWRRLALFGIFLSVGLVCWVPFFLRVVLAQSRPSELPDSSRLVLKSTVVGASQKTARINNSLYHEGDEVFVGKDRYRVASISTGKVALCRGQIQFDLEIPPGGNRTSRRQ